MLLGNEVRGWGNYGIGVEGSEIREHSREISGHRGTGIGRRESAPSIEGVIPAASRLRNLGPSNTVAAVSANEIPGVVVQSTMGIARARTATRLFRKIRRAFSRVVVPAANGVVDRGFFDLHPLRSHVVICGFPRSGSTLVQVMLASALPNARHFPNEIPALVAAKEAFRNSTIMVTKFPRDIVSVDRIRSFYARRYTEPLFLIMVRDPRDVLTSVHGSLPDRYYVDSDRVAGVCSAVLPLMTPAARDTCVVRYEELVSNPSAVETQIASLLPLEGELTNYLTRSTLEWDESLHNALGQLRPVEGSRVGRWRAPEHDVRIREAMRASPELPTLIERLGY